MSTDQQREEEIQALGWASMADYMAALSGHSGASPVALWFASEAAMTKGVALMNLGRAAGQLTEPQLKALATLCSTEVAAHDAGVAIGRILMLSKERDSGRKQEADLARAELERRGLV